MSRTRDISHPSELRHERHGNCIYCAGYGLVSSDGDASSDVFPCYTCNACGGTGSSEGAEAL